VNDTADMFTTQNMNSTGVPTPLQPAALARVARAIALDVAGVRCTSRQRNTHSTESRQVRYPWHPRCGRSVTVYEALTKGGHPVCWREVDVVDE
jgi:hypothetical protein